jgi:DNA-binding SARP family transcriptional activator
MPSVRIKLFGPPAVILGDQATPATFCAAKPLALVAYLALDPGPHSREHLATLLWSESPQDAARASLRQALADVRRCLGEHLRADRRSIELVGAVDCDVRAFLEAVEREPATAVEHEVGQFLSGLAPRRAPAFDEWRDTTARRLLARYRDALQTLIRDARADSDWSAVVHWAQRWLDHEPLAEEAVRATMEGHYLGGHPAAALDVFERYRRQLKAETDTEPNARFAALADRIAQAQPGPPVPARPGRPSRDSGAFHTQLVGRATEWQRLMEAWAPVAHGRGRTILIEGEQGAGKTRLTEEFLRWAALQGVVVLRGAGYDARSGIPYAPLAAALRGVLDAPGLGGTDPEWLVEVARLVPDLRQRFPTLPDPMTPASGTDRWRLFEGVAQILLAVAADHPVVLAVDDLQWFDDDSCALLHFLTGRLERAPVALVATVTLGDLDREVPSWRLRRALRAEPSTMVLSLRHFEPADVLELLRSLGGMDADTLTTRLAASIQDVTDGNPFYIIELVKTLCAQDLIRVDPGSGTWQVTPALQAGMESRFDMPETVHEAIAQRVDRLPYEMRDLLATAAVAGRAVGTDLLSQVHGISRLRAAALADALVERMLLAEEHQHYRCSHPVIGDVVQELLTPARRAETHRAIALSIEAVTTPEGRHGLAGEIARHAQRGNEPRMAYRYALMASDEAAQRYAFEDALKWLDLAAETAAEESESAEVDRRTSLLLPLVGGEEQSRASGARRGPLGASEPPGRPRRRSVPRG